MHRCDRWRTLEALVWRGALDSIFRSGSTEEALKQGPQKFFALAAEVARGQFDPAIEWDGFLQALWEQVDAGFGLTTGEQDSDLPLAWSDESGDGVVVVWDPRWDGS